MEHDLQCKERLISSTITFHMTFVHMSLLTHRTRRDLPPLQRRLQAERGTIQYRCTYGSTSIDERLVDVDVDEGCELCIPSNWACDA